jgi:ABC-type nitrate/sulfonate/bicarbonate transport system ATPase subunit/ABC-type nitrate/sulfonate/bicarbonate transport system permease component
VTSLPSKWAVDKAVRAGAEKSSEPPVWKTRWGIFSAIPLAVVVALALHWFTSKKEPPGETQLYTYFLAGLFLASICAAAVQTFWSGLRRWMRTVGPLIAVTILFLTGWELTTSGFRLLPMPYFPSPAGVLQSLVNDRDLLFDSTCHSLLLLLGGYTLGVAAGLFSGVCIGWFPQARYWGMPVLKIVGPIPATAWIPLAMVLSPSAMFSAVALIALAVWFPVTMLTASGVSNTRASYLDVARTLGADRRYLIFHVAIPAAMPSIFIGLFMGLGASFLTLVVAETVGVKSGLGWYVSWAQGWAEYGKVYAALVIMAAFFSTIMIRESLCCTCHHGCLFLDHHDGPVQGSRPRTCLAEGGYKMVGTLVGAVTTEGSSVSVEDVTKDFEARDRSAERTIALDAISFSVAAGEMISIIGPSGCGKSTLLRLIAGLDFPNSGELRVGSEAITGSSAERGLVFQDPNLFPWLTVRHNIQAGLVALGILREKRREVNEFISLVGLEGFADVYPHHLSGGMAQRVALARALITHPKVLLLDEPLGALDAFTRMRMQDEVLRLWQARLTTTLLVTHDIDEAIYMSDRILILTPRPGRVDQTIPVDLARPRDRSGTEFLRLRSEILQLLHFAGNAIANPKNEWK